MGTYDTQQVCMNGHQITDTFNHYPEHRKNYCPMCGAETIYQCPNCKTNIPGRYWYSENSSGNTAQIPSFCKNCGAKFPWTEKLNQIRRALKNLKDQKPDNTVNGIQIIERIIQRFHLTAKQLRERYDARQTLDIEDEYDVQDLLHALLRIYFDDIRPEEWTPSYAGSCSRVDFLLKEEKIIIEVKKTRKSLGGKELGEQLIIDIEKYKNHPDCKTLYCFVYDPEGRIPNPQGIEKDLNREVDGFKVIVHIVPKGY